MPRLVNTLCDTALMVAFALGHPSVGQAEMKTAIEELQWVEYAARTNRMLAAMTTPATLGASGAGAGEVMARIVIAHDGSQIGERSLCCGRLIIGRTPDNDLQVDNKFVSRHHCQIITTAEGSVIEDPNSTNGIYVKSKRVRRHHLNDGDVVVPRQA